MGWMEEFAIAKWEVMVFMAFIIFMGAMLHSIKDMGIFNLYLVLGLSQDVDFKNILPCIYYLVRFSIRFYI